MRRVFSFNESYKLEHKKSRRAFALTLGCQQNEADSEKIRAMAATTSRHSVQGYFQPRYDRYHGIFYDLEDIVAKSGATEEELAELRAALDECVLCKYATARFLDEFTINTLCEAFCVSKGTYYIRLSRETGYDKHRFRRSGSGFHQGRYISFTWNQY